MRTICMATTAALLATATPRAQAPWNAAVIDDKDNLVGALMLVLMLKRTNAALDRDVIFLAESGEEGTPEVGAQFMIDNHFAAVEAEFCLAEGGGLVRTGGQVLRANVGTTEKEPRAVELIARGPAGHGSVPSRNNAVTRLSAAVGKVAEWTPPLRVRSGSSKPSCTASCGISTTSSWRSPEVGKEEHR
jgi:acetylornithine deacetylase/succinyl-diaminopimelate desuccinylase-like protein